ncbi:conserved protein of unknown function (plasmid) [Rhodovastum atsumiense]|uniref:LysM domain-containing protein n=1 Tax=Rhodovastum atsumiense TaxID=504468 RepID=A0A5M6IQ11_9PROT|nr:hypothetical protein [Rhodovastum atsumiense]KAA5609648.1 hypothetical protein F1189_23075 [Rhodovastum atsumiense]CAH2606514.1 conserved protein of unknown function [Rhodovastum atsumiense]
MRTITVIGGNLFRIAADYLRDATQATRIAEVNGLSDFVLSGQVTLRIPNADPSAAGGVPDQS